MTGILGKRYLIAGDYNTVNPIAIRKVDVYTENKRCIAPIGITLRLACFSLSEL